MDSSNASTPELLAYIQQLQQQMVALQNSQALLQENAKNHPIEQAKASTVKTKVPPPDTFHGQRHEVKPFLSNLAIYIKLRPEEFPNEETKLLFAASFLRGRAFDWFRPYEQNLSAQANSETRSLQMNTIQEFYTAITETFGDPDEGLTAATRIYRLKQTRSVSDYISEYQTLASQLQWNEDALRDLYFQGLKPNIQAAIVQGIMPSTLRDMIKVSSNLDQRLYQYNKSSYSYQQTSGRAQHALSGYTHHADAMDLDALTFKTRANPPPSHQSGHLGPRGPLTEDEKLYRKNNNLCLYCAKPGHSVESCYALKKKPNEQAKNLDA